MVIRVGSPELLYLLTRLLDNRETRTPFARSPFVRRFAFAVCPWLHASPQTSDTLSLLTFLQQDLILNRRLSRGTRDKDGQLAGGNKEESVARSLVIAVAPPAVDARSLHESSTCLVGHLCCRTAKAKKTEKKKGATQCRLPWMLKPVLRSLRPVQIL